MTPYQEWISQPEVQAKILAGLDALSTGVDALSTGVPEDWRPSLGICWYLKNVPGYPVRHEIPNEYTFVYRHSEAYEVFQQADLLLRGAGRWDGERGEFRQEWCKNMAAALRADPSLWLKGG